MDFDYWNYFGEVFGSIGLTTSNFLLCGTHFAGRYTDPQIISKKAYLSSNSFQHLWTAFCLNVVFSYSTWQFDVPFWEFRSICSMILKSPGYFPNCLQVSGFLFSSLVLGSFLYFIDLPSNFLCSDLANLEYAFGFYLADYARGLGFLFDFGPVSRNVHSQLDWVYYVVWFLACIFINCL